ncbi:MAG: sodium/proline symporter [Clostridia bacterium]|nr:sodium/proline symporter [Clostridia bacterium]
MTTALIIFSIVVYMAAMIVIGVICAKQNKNSDDFYLGGRTLGPLVTAMSAEASDMSSWLLMGLPGVALLTGVAGNTTGFAEAFWTALGLAIGTYLNFFFVARKIRLYSEKTNSNTIPDFFSDRFRDKSGMIMFIAAVIIIVFFIPYTGSGFAAIGKLMNSLFGINYHVALIAGAAVIAVYTVIGGFTAASVTDLVQSIVMTIALIVIVFFGIDHADGIGNIFANLPAENYFNLMGTDGTSYGFFPIVSTLAWGLGYFGMPHILLRFMAIKDDKKLTLSRRIATVWVVISMAVAILIGIIGYSFAMKEGMIGTEGFDSERIIVYMAQAIAKNGWIAAIIAGVIIAGILAATMSTADSQLLAAASSVSENIFKRFFVKNMSEKTSMWVARGTVIAISLVSVILAWNPDASVFRIVSFAWAGFGAAFGPLVLMALFWRRTNKYGAFAGIISGGVMVFVWKYIIADLGGIFAIYELLPAFIISLIAIVVVSLLTGAPEKAIVEEFDEMKIIMKKKQ